LRLASRLQPAPFGFLPVTQTANRSSLMTQSEERARVAELPPHAHGLAVELLRPRQQVLERRLGRGRALLLLVGRSEVAPDRDVHEVATRLLVSATPDGAGDLDFLAGPAAGALLPLVRNLVAGIDVEVAAERAAQAVGDLCASGDHLELAARAHGLVDVLLGHLEQVVDGDFDGRTVLPLVLVHLCARGSRESQREHERRPGPPHESSIGTNVAPDPAFFRALARARDARESLATRHFRPFVLVMGLT
jgi:hypothetical protein